MSYPSNASCPCGSGNTFNQCCEAVIANDSASTPEALMRSRYSAYASQQYQYVLNTYTVATRPAVNAQQLAEDNQSTRWLALEVISTTSDKDIGTVDFIAYFVENEQLLQLAEHSRFVMSDGKWRYVNGDIKAHGVVKKGRNETCVCGSGKKFKRCCSPLISAG